MAVPAIPDIVAVMDSKVGCGKKKTVTDQRIIEVEMNPTAVSKRRKETQYSDNLRGWMLTILDARTIRGMRKGPENITLGAIDDWLKKNL